MKKTILFDLDGTLTNSSEGILNSIRYMMEKLELEIPDEATLYSFIGPPLTESLQQLYGMTPAEATAAVNVYREYYGENGLEQLSLYPGIEAMLDKLRSNYYLAIATSKPEPFAKRIIEAKGLSKYFIGIFGAELVGERSKKADVIAYALEKLGTSSAVMVGDRKYDILGAKANYLPSIGVLYGFGDRSELLEAGANQIVATPAELLEAINELWK